MVSLKGTEKAADAASKAASSPPFYEVSMVKYTAAGIPPPAVYWGKDFHDAARMIEDTLAHH